jgi:hypothetical protein
VIRFLVRAIGAGPTPPLQTLSCRELLKQCLGFRIGHQRYLTRTIRLFDSKYISSFNTHMECVAFVNGVEAVLNYMLEAKDVQGLNLALNRMLDVKGCETPAQPAA